MKQRKSNNYLVISSAHIGVSPDILQIYANVAKQYKAKVIHLGPTSTDEEIRKYSKLQADVVKYQNAVYLANTDRQQDTASEKLAEAQRQFMGAGNAEQDRTDALMKAFGKVTFVTTEDMSLPRQRAKNGPEWINGGLELSHYLFLSPVPPGGVKATRAPITAASLAYLKEMGKSWIVAHPIPAIECFAKPGLNEAHNFFTVGCLKHPIVPTHTKNQYQFAHMPCAILVLIDKDNDEFHATQIHIDYIGNKTGKILRPMAMHDGLVFKPDGVTSSVSDDLATFATDYHAPAAHPGVLGAHRLLNTLLKPATLIDGGDTCDFGSVSHHTEDRPGESEGHRLSEDLAALRYTLNAVCNEKSIKKKILIDSNHHEWLTQYVMKNPALIGMCDWYTLSRDMFPDWEMILREAGENKIFTFGDLSIRHGDKEGGAAQAQRLPFNKYLCGHWHKYVAYRRAIQIGCGAKLGPKYVGNQINAWQSQIASITRHQEITAVSPKIILHDKKKEVSRFAFGGTIYESEFYHIKF